MSPTQIISPSRAAVRRNTLLLAAGMGALYGMVELVAAIAALTFVAIGGSTGFAGVAPAIFLATGALAGLPAGRAMDRFGRVPVLAAGFGIGICGSVAAALGASSESVIGAVLGFALVGFSQGTIMLSRAAAADMHPPAGRARAIALVLFGAVFGALLGPAVFSPLLAGGEVKVSSLAAGWLGAAGFMLVGLLLMTGIRPDPQKIARGLAAAQTHEGSVAPLSSIVRRPGSPPALVAAIATWSPMVALMTLVGPAMVAHGHSRTDIFPVLSAHFVGMFALFLIVGLVIDRIGRAPTLVGGLLLLGVSSLAIPSAIHSLPLTAVTLFGVGLGWSFAYLAATAELADNASAAERGKLLGFADFLSGLAGAGLTLLGGFILVTLGLTALSIGGAVLPILSALWILRGRLSRRFVELRRWRSPRLVRSARKRGEVPTNSLEHKKNGLGP